MGIETLTLSPLKRGAIIGASLGAITTITDFTKILEFQNPISINLTKYDAISFFTCLALGTAIGGILSIRREYERKEEDLYDSYLGN